MDVLNELRHISHFGDIVYLLDDGSWCMSTCEPNEGKNVGRYMRELLDVLDSQCSHTPTVENTAKAYAELPESPISDNGEHEPARVENRPQDGLEKTKKQLREIARAEGIGGGKQ